MARSHKEEIPSITSATTSRSQLIDRKERDYLLSMAVRTLCFVGFAFIDHPIRWLLLLGAVFLPYIAVVIGNSSIRKAGDGPSPYGGSTYALGKSEPARDLSDSGD